jgi:hypothetical protein
MAEFVANLDRINALAENSEGFVWRLKVTIRSSTHPIEQGCQLFL